MGNGMPPGRPRLYASRSERNAAYWKRKKQQIKVYHRAQTVEWGTPNALFAALEEEFHFTLDVAAQPDNAKCGHYYTPELNGLVQPWHGICWMNPPYGPTMDQWMCKAHASSLAGATVVCLVPARTDTLWWQTYATQGEIRFLKGRLTFGNAKNPAPFPSAVVIFRPPP